MYRQVLGTIWPEPPLRVLIALPVWEHDSPLLWRQPRACTPHTSQGVHAPQAALR